MTISRVIGGHPFTKKWLVEWRDLSRTWEDFETVKNLDVFRHYIEQHIETLELAVEQHDYQPEIEYTQVTYIC